MGEKVWEGMKLIRERNINLFLPTRETRRVSTGRALIYTLFGGVMPYWLFAKPFPILSLFF